MLYARGAMNVPGNGVRELWAVLQGSLHLPRSEQLDRTCHKPVGPRWRPKEGTHMPRPSYNGDPFHPRPHIIKQGVR